MTQKLNILLELDEAGEWMFAIVSNTELSIKLQTNDKQYNKIKKNPLNKESHKFQNNWGKFEVQMYYEESKIIMRSDCHTKPPESVLFVKDEKTEVKDEILKFDFTDQPGYTKELIQVKPAPTMPSISIVEPVSYMMHRQTLEPVDSSWKMAELNQKSVKVCLSHLPENLQLPNLNKIPPKYTGKIIQPDKTITYIQRPRQKYLWITNFDLHAKKCDICSNSSSNVGTMIHHRLSLHFFPGNKDTCNGCQKLCPTKEEKKLHSLYCLKKEHIRPNFCYDCNMQCSNNMLYRAHISEEHPVEREEITLNYACDLCYVRCKTQKSLENHKKMHDAVPFQCDLCGYTCKSKPSIKQHLIQHHFTKKAKFKCDLCWPIKFFYSVSTFVKHRMIVHSNYDDAQEKQEKLQIIEDNNSHEDTEDDVFVVPIEKPEPVVILDSDDDFEMVEYVSTNSKVEEEHSYTVAFIDKVEEDLSRLPLVKKAAVVKKRRRLTANVPKGVLMPDWKKLVPPFAITHPQPDGTLAYLYKASDTSKLMVTNFNLAGLQCEICDEKFGLIRAFLVHHRDVHFFPGSTSKCNGCAEMFNSLQEKHLHSMYCPRRSTIRVAFCYICNIQFSNHLQFRHHLKVNHQKEARGKPRGETRICHICSKDIPIRSIKRHMNGHEHTEKFQCDHCQTFYNTRFTLQCHLIKKHFPLLCKFVCTDCTPHKYCTKKSEYLTHKAVAHPVSEGSQVECPQCGKLVQTSLLTSHIRKAHSQKRALEKTDMRYSCSTCGKLFTRSMGLKTHLLMHLPESERKHKCQYCSKGFNSFTALQEHERDHTGEKPYHCEHCGKDFAKGQTFKDHVKTHTGQGYNCEHCGRMLWDHSSYRKHLKTHEAQLGIKLTYTREERRLKDLGLLEEMQGTSYLS